MGTMELAVVGLAGSGIGAALGVPMVWPRSARSVDVRLMGGWLLALSVIAGIISARLIGLLPQTAAVNHSINLLGLAAYPLLYLYVREQTQPATRLRDWWWLWVPAAVYAFIVMGRGAAGLSTRVPFAWMLPVLLAFTALCVRSVIRREKRQGPALVPAGTIVTFLVVLNAAQVVRMFFGHLPLIPALVPLVVTGGFISLVAIVMWRSVEPRPAVKAVMPAPRYEKSGLDQDAAMALLASIDGALSANRLFADTGLTLGRLAAAAGSTPHQVSEVLNRYANVTFHELVSRRRVADVKEHLSGPDADRFTIEGIGASAGFGSRSALYAAFKRFEGMTPAEFRARQK